MLRRAALALALACGVGGAAAAAARRSAELEVAADAERVIADKIAPRRDRVRVRLRALYRASRDDLERGLFDPRRRWRRARARADLIQILRRDTGELRALEAELGKVAAARRRLEAAPAPADPDAPPLLRPVAGAAAEIAAPGRLSFEVERGAAVRAPAAGAVVYRGDIRGLGTGVIIESEDRWIVLGPLDPAAVGGRVERGQNLGSAAAGHLLLEARTVDELGGAPIDPVPLAE